MLFSDEIRNRIERDIQVLQDDYVYLMMIGFKELQFQENTNPKALKERLDRYGPVIQELFEKLREENEENNNMEDRMDSVLKQLSGV